MSTRQQSPSETVSWPTTRPALVCMMCGRQVGEVVAGRLVHHADCSGSLTRVGRLLRCCNCGGSVVIDDATT